MAVLFFAENSIAALSTDTGKIKSLYVNSSGGVAILFENGFVNANSSGQCPTTNITSYGGNLTADPIFKSTLLAAKAAQQTITVSIQGCEAGGGWFKIVEIYVN